MDTPNSPVDPCSAPAAPRVPRPVRILVGGLAVLALVTTLAVTGAVVHASATPDFWDYVKDVRASDELARPLPGETRVLAASGDLQLGEADPFAVPEPAREFATFDVVLKQGDEELLHFRHTCAWSFGADGATRTSFALRTEQLTTHAGLRARVRIGVDAFERLVGPESAQAGALTYDVTLLAGSGESRVDLVECLPPAKGELEPEDATSTPLENFAPRSTVPSSGLVQHLRDSLRLSAVRRDGGGQSVGWQECEFASSTHHYGCDLQVEVRNREFQHRWTRRDRFDLGFHAR